MTIDVKQAAELLKSQNDILILSHQSPDGDTLGCAFSLCYALKQLGKRVRFECEDEIPKKFYFLCKELTFEQFEPNFIVAVDVADSKLLGDETEKKYQGKVNLCIDHHMSHRPFAEKIVLENRAAACEIMLDVITELGVKFEKNIADCLYTGISTDTGCFRYSNTTVHTHLSAARLIEYGADSSEIDRRMFETKTKTYMMLERLALNSLEMYFDDRCAVMCVTKEMFRLSGSNESECDGISALPRQIEGVLAGVTIREKGENEYKISLRTNAPLDASKICERMGGGGHQRASGCTVNGSLAMVKQIVLNNIKDFL